MPRNLCFYFEVHQPYRINLPGDSVDNLNDVLQGPSGDNPAYTYGNYNLFTKAAKNCYIPATGMWLTLLAKFPELHLTLSISGTFLEQCLEYGDIGAEVLKGFQDLVATGQVELLNETYYHSLASMLDEREFINQIIQHRQIIQQLFDYSTKNFRNTELIYNNRVAQIVQSLGFGATVIEDATNGKLAKVRNNSPVELESNIFYLCQQSAIAQPSSSLTLLTKDYDLVSQFFSIRHHTTAEMVERTLTNQDSLVGVFTDFEVFGEHNYIGDQVFEKVHDYIEELHKLNFKFLTVNEAKNHFQTQNLPVYDCPDSISWTNSWHNLVSWRGNEFQETAFEQLSQTLIQSQKWQIDTNSQDKYNFWQKLTTSDHFYYMADLPGPDGIVHQSFNAFSSSKEAYEVYTRVLNWLPQS